MIPWQFESGASTAPPSAESITSGGTNLPIALIKPTAVPQRNTAHGPAKLPRAI